MYRFNIQILEIDAKEIPSKVVPKNDLGIPKLNTELSVNDLFMLLNRVNTTPVNTLKEENIYITGYENNYNFYLNTQKFDAVNETIDLKSSKVKRDNNLLYTPNISENLNHHPDNILYQDNVVVVRYKIKFMSNYLIEGLGKL